MAALDVLETEPPRAGDPVVAHPRVMITPHVGWYSEPAVKRLRTYLAERCAAYLIGKQGATLVNSGVPRAPAPVHRTGR